MRARIPPRHRAPRFLLPTLMVSVGACQMVPFHADDEAARDAPPGAAQSAPGPGLMVAPVELPNLERKSPPAPASDLWRDIRRSFTLDHALEQPRVRQELAWLKRHPEYLPRLESRLRRYMPHIHAEVRKRDLPGELALLPIVESALDPYAFSHGGAAGLWQFIPATAQRFGVPRNWWIDGRRDPVLATRAALDYLEYLHRRLGSWQLAVAGYNAGEGNVLRAIRRAGGDASFWNLQLPRETRAYVPRLLALSALVADPDEHGVELPSLVPTPRFATIETDGQFDLMKVASVLDMELETIYDWNPALNQWATPPDGPHHLHVPAGMADAAQRAIDAVPEDQRVRWLRVEVDRGETLSHLAHRHRTDVPTLRRVNGLDDTRIRAGQALLVPRTAEALEAYPTAQQQSGDYQVAPGDSLWSIARDHGVPLDRLVKANRIGPREVLRVGQRLRVPGTSGGSTPERGREVIRKVRYGVRRGDSLARIASRFNVAVSDLARWNELDVQKYLKPGQKLLIYVNVSAAE